MLLGPGGSLSSIAISCDNCSICKSVWHFVVKNKIGQKIKTGPLGRDPYRYRYGSHPTCDVVRQTPGADSELLKSERTVFLSLTVCVQRVAVNVSTGQNYRSIGNTNTTGIFPFQSKSV